MPNLPEGKQLNTARWILIVVGVLTAGVHGFLLYSSEKSVQNEVQELQIQGMEIDQAEVDKILNFNRMLLGSFFVLGIVFILLGIFVYAAPVPCTVTGLVLYILGMLSTALIDPLSIFSGIIIKVLNHCGPLEKRSKRDRLFERVD